MGMKLDVVRINNFAPKNWSKSRIRRSTSGIAVAITVNNFIKSLWWLGRIKYQEKSRIKCREN